MMTGAPIPGGSPVPGRSHGTGYVLLIAVAAALGGLLFGYDTAVISGGIDFLAAHFGIGEADKGWAASCALLGCIVGAMAGGPLGDRFGRKPMLIACALLFGLSGLASALPATLNQFVAARLVGGFAIGAVSVLSPLYIAEIAPVAVRGRLVALYQLAIVVGIALVFFVNLAIQRQGDLAWNQAVGWRWMMGSMAVPSALFLLMALIIPESPRWLMRAGRRDRAREVLVRVAGPAGAERELQEVAASLAQPDSGAVRELLGRRYRRPLLIGVALAVIQQFCGINSIMYYGPSIFHRPGQTDLDAAFWFTAIVGLVNLVFTFVAIWLVDRAGRKPLLIVGSVVQVLALAACGLAFQQQWSGGMLLAAVLVFIAAFAAAMGPVPWILISEIFPNRMRGLAMSLATFVLWTACFAVSETFPWLRSAIGPAWTFWGYALCSLLGLVFILAMIPETRGRSLEEIEGSWRN
jgi:SP family arabinose:H+ symporter-like MFS transporter